MCKAVCREEKVVQSGNIITGRGLGTAIDFALRLTEVLFGREQEEKDAEASALSAYEKQLEERVKELLRMTEGVGEADVMIVLKSSGEKIIHEDQKRRRASSEETDSAGGTRKTVDEEAEKSAVFVENDSEKEPIVEKELRPAVEGVVISAQGGGNASVKTEISEAMQALFNIPAHKIKVLKRVD